MVGRLVFILQDAEIAIRACEKMILGRELDVFRADKRTLGILIEDLKKEKFGSGRFSEDIFQRLLLTLQDNTDPNTKILVLPVHLIEKINGYAFDYGQENGKEPLNASSLEVSAMDSIKFPRKSVRGKPQFP